MENMEPRVNNRGKLFKKRSMKREPYKGKDPVMLRAVEEMKKRPVDNWECWRNIEDKYS